MLFPASAASINEWTKNVAKGRIRKMNILILISRNFFVSLAFFPPELTVMEWAHQAIWKLQSHTHKHLNLGPGSFPFHPWKLSALTFSRHIPLVGIPGEKLVQSFISLLFLFHKRNYWIISNLNVMKNSEEFWQFNFTTTEELCYANISLLLFYPAISSFTSLRRCAKKMNLKIIIKV